jgi:hypothetical protein
MENKKNSVGGAVAVLLVSLRKKKQAIETAYKADKVTKEERDHVLTLDKNPNEEITKTAVINIRLADYAIVNSEEIINKIAIAVDWSGTADTLQERLKKVFSSCIANDKKRPKILSELAITGRELVLIESMVEALKSKSALNITAIDI